MNEIFEVSGTVKVSTLSVVFAKKKGVHSFLEFTSKIWITIVHKRAVRI